MKDDKEEGDNINLKIASSKTWSNLPKYANGKEIKYAVAISDVSGYTKKVTGSVADGYVAECIDKGLTLETLPLESYRELSELFEDDIYTAISLETCVRERKSFGGPAPESVIKQIEITKKQLGAYYE